ncbi:MAG TPA: hypothetical protein VLC93_13160 [Myxococcota bacterium]|nr:hypothetical protein [Myxococcota bacterium]
MQIRVMVLGLGLLGLVACRSTKPGTHVEVMDEGGTKVYVAGAAGPGMNQGLACDTAVSRSVAAIALRFTQDNDDIQEAVAKEVGVEDGRVFLERFARAKMQSAAVQDTQFNPGEHLCMATVRWTPPVFAKDAVKAYAEEVKAQEYTAMHPKDAENAPAQPTAPASSVPPAASPTTQQPSPSATAPAQPPPAQPTLPECPKEKSKLAKADEAMQKAQDELDECVRRTSGNTKTCSRYQLYVDQAAAKQKSAQEALTRCISR